ncbi:hypothetical protein CYMTET_10105 [Cymbomonas tetramitiformis]|uniref:Reverse transcriptase domain-containing protein n=1 Tax=Cymbomonas tetramitiformis TaxID=36881 RepID=A0AAE0GPS7_9CHLO|nr:hypothetical protein CYMTET_10105 [Cymbomonas tetramitiformis]
MVRDLLDPDGYMWSFDFTSGYHHVELHPDSHQYVAFEWQGKFYCCAVLPFGLACAPYVFTRIGRELAKRWRQQGMKLIHYLDDFIFFGVSIAGSLVVFLLQQATVLADLDAAGFLLNWEKSVLQPIQRLAFLGMGIDSVRGLFYAPQQKWDSLQARVAAALKSRRVKVRALASIAGKVMSLRLALGKAAFMFTREMYFVVESAARWDAYISLPPEVISELQLWADTGAEGFTSAIWDLVVRAFCNLIWTDAGATGWGGWLAPLGARERLDARGHLSLAERAESSTLRELVGILKTLQSLARFVVGTTVHLHTDSQSAWRILMKGCSSKAPLHKLAVEIFWWTVHHGVHLEVSWIPCTLNEYADYLAGIYDSDDWMLSTYWFEVLDALWGRHTVDRFATDKNHLLPRFNSRWWCPGTENVNCFLNDDWFQENNWCNPPFGLVGQLLRCLIRHGARATVICPRWTGRHWWPLLCPDGVHFAPFVVDWRELPTDSIEPLFRPGAGRANEAAVGPPSFRVLALRIDGSLGTL